MEITLNKSPPTSLQPRREQASPISLTGTQTLARSAVQQEAPAIHSREIVAPDLSELAARIDEIIISPDEDTHPRSPQQVFWSLGHDWWKQLIDGTFHRHGPLVFDQGLHGGHVEPGFYHSARQACKYACKHMADGWTVEFYQRMHRIACQHFAGDSNDTLMSASESGKFISPIEKGLNCRGSLSTLFCADPERYQEIQRVYATHKRAVQVVAEVIATRGLDRKKAILDREGITFKQAAQINCLSKKWLKDFYADCAHKLRMVNLRISVKSLQLGLTHPIATLSIDSEDPDKIFVKYECTKEEVDHVVEALFTEYEDKMRTAYTKDEKLGNIASLFQMLDWLHPFNDGQGRTDLILLAKELCRHGFNPAILDDPYFSTFSNLNDWIVYLEAGMEKWRQLDDQLHSPRTTVETEGE